MRERGQEGEKEGEKHQCERDINQLPLSCPQLGTWPTTQTYALTGDQTGDPSVCRLAFNPLSHTSQGMTFCIIACDLIYFPRSDKVRHIRGGMAIDDLICLIVLWLNSSIGVGRINQEPGMYSGIQHLCPECLLCARHCVGPGMRGFSPQTPPPQLSL